MMPRCSRSSLLFSAACAIALLMTVGCETADDDSLINPGTGTSDSVLSVNVMKVSRDEKTIETAVFFGTLKPNRQSRLLFGRGGKIKTIFKQVGEEANEGDKLAELEQQSLEDQKLEVEQALADAEKNLETADPNLRASVQQQIQQLESQLQTIESELEKGVLVAPFDCIVAEISMEAGNPVSLQTPVLQVIENSMPLVETNLPRDVAETLSVGDSGWVSMGDQDFQVKVKTKSPVESPIGSRTVTLQITEEVQQAVWSYGQSVKTRFLLPTDNSGFWLPLSALHRESNGLWSTFVISPTVVEDGSTDDSTGLTVTRKVLELVQLESEWALADGAFVDGEFVIVDGSHRIVPGQRVVPVDVTEQFSKPGAAVNTGANE